MVKKRINYNKVLIAYRITMARLEKAEIYFKKNPSRVTEQMIEEYQKLIGHASILIKVIRSELYESKRSDYLE